MYDVHDFVEYKYGTISPLLDDFVTSHVGINLLSRATEQNVRELGLIHCHRTNNRESFIDTSMGTSKRPFPGLVNSVPAVAYHFCPKLLQHSRNLGTAF